MMKDYIIAVASTADLDNTWLEAHHVPFIPYHFVLNGKEYDDDCTKGTKEFLYRQMLDGADVHTAAISTYEYHSFFTKLMAEGKDVLYLDMSSAISSSISNAYTAVQMIQSEGYHDQRLYFLDSFAITDILGLLVKKLVSMKEAGASFDEVIQYGESHKFNYTGRFMIDNLKWLAKGGRLSNASSVAGNLLQIKPLIIVDSRGELVAYNKVHGRRKAFAQLVADMKNDMDENTKNEEIAVIHSGTPEDAEKFKGMIQSAYPELTNISINELGPVIAVHTGPGFMAVVTPGKQRK